MIKYANLYETNGWEYLLSKKILWLIQTIQTKKNCLLTLKK